jgi:AcrR family transcriptional regulator
MNQGSERRTRVPRLRSRLRKATSEAILDAAEAGIAERGLRGAGMVEIAERAGVSVGTLYNHFADKDALLAALLQDRRRELAARIEAALGPRQEDPFRAQLAAFTEAFAAHFEAHRRFLQILWDEEAARGAPLVKRNASPIADVLRRLEKLMQQGAREGALRGEGAPLLAAAYMGMLKAVLIKQTRTGKGAGAPAATLVRLFLEGASARTPARRELARRRDPG